eukprot:jgi/Ulvmu1/382/UM001_0389.1
MESADQEQLVPSPIPSNVTPKDAKKYKKLAVLKVYKAPPDYESRRIPDALQHAFPDLFPTVSAAKKAARRGLVLVDDEVASTSVDLASEQTMKYLTRVVPPAPLDASAAPVALQVAYEDDHIAAVVKPQGMPTIKMGTHKAGLSAAAECIKFCLTMPSIPGVLRWPQAAHRLDAETGGLLICAKTTVALQELSHAFVKRAMLKRYRALVRGALRGCGRVTLRLSGDDCDTEYRSVAVHASAKCGHVTVVDLWPRTGRTHQLRRHMMMLGHPILGDVKYWRREPATPAQLRRGLREVEEAELAAAPQHERAVLASGMAAAEGAAEGAEAGGARPASAVGASAADEGAVAGTFGGADPGVGATGIEGEVGQKRARECEEGAGTEGAEGGGGGMEQGKEGAEEGPGGKWGRCEQEAALAERMCLWKVECKVLHPVSREVVCMQTEQPPLFDAVLAAHKPAE